MKNRTEKVLKDGYNLRDAIKSRNWIAGFFIGFAIGVLAVMLIVYGAPAGSDCQAVIIANASGHLNKTYALCASEPTLNVTNVTNITQQITILNYTFNETSVAGAIDNQTMQIIRLYGNVSEQNVTIQKLLDENSKFLDENKKLNSRNPSYEVLYELYNETVRNNTALEKKDRDNENNKPLLIGIGFIVGAGIVFYFNRKQKEPIDRLTPASGQVRGHGEEQVDQRAIDDELKKIEQDFLNKKRE